MLVVASSNLTTKITAGKLELVQLDNWLKNGKTADEAFELLLLNKGNPLVNNALTTWKSYVEMTRKDPDDVLFEVLSLRLGDEGLAKILLEKRKFKEVAAKLIELQLGNWKSSGKSADDVFDLLKLTDKGDNVFTDSLFNTWVSYATKLNEKNLDEVIYMTLKSFYKEEGLATLIATAKNKMDTRRVLQ